MIITHNEMSQNIAQRIKYSGLVVFILCNAALALWMLSQFRRDLSAAEKPDTPPKSLSSAQWSAGSAFFTVAATCFGFYAQPRGSLLFSKSGRVWRLSPLYAFADTITIFWVWTNALCRVHQFYQRWPSFRTMAVSILVMRIANDKDAFQETAGVRIYHAPKIRRSSTLSGSNTQDDNSMSRFFEEVDRFESGPSFRIFVWTPMLLQFVKLLVVRGSWLPRSLGFIFFLSWLINDILLIAASSDTLTSTEKLHATFIVDHGNPQALKLTPGCYLNYFYRAVMYAQSTVSVCLIAAFATGGWQNMIALQNANSSAFSQWGQVWAVSACSLWCHFSLLMAMDLICQIYKTGGVDEKKALLLEGTPAYSAIIDWVLRLLCFLSISPLERFHDTKKTYQPSWYEWLG